MAAQALEAPGDRQEQDAEPADEARTAGRWSRPGANGVARYHRAFRASNARTRRGHGHPVMDLAPAPGSAPPRPLAHSRVVLPTRRRVLGTLASLALAAAAAGCCVNPFIDTDTQRAQDVPGTPERETGGSLEEHEPAVQATAEDSSLTGFDMRLVRVQPGVHLDTEQVCHVSAAGRVEAIAEDDAERYGERATQRMSVRCAAVTGEGWADLVFSATSAGHAPEVTVGARVRVRILRADGGFFDYPIVEFVETEALGDPSLAAPGSEGTPAVVGALPTGFDLRRAQTDPAAVGSVQSCAVSHAGDIEMLDAEDAHSRAYPAGAQNRMTIRCRHAQGEEWADLVFMPAQALTALHIGRGDVIRVAVVSRTGGFFDYPVLQLVEE